MLKAVWKRCVHRCRLNDRMYRVSRVCSGVCESYRVSPVVGQLELGLVFRSMSPVNMAVKKICVCVCVCV